MAETIQNGEFIGVYSLWPVRNYGKQVMVMNGKLVITYSKRNEISIQKSNSLHSGYFISSFLDCM